MIRFKQVGLEYLKNLTGKTGHLRFYTPIVKVAGDNYVLRTSNTDAKGRKRFLCSILSEREFKYLRQLCNANVQLNNPEEK